MSDSYLDVHSDAHVSDDESGWGSVCVSVAGSHGLPEPKELPAGGMPGADFPEGQLSQASTSSWVPISGYSDASGRFVQVSRPPSVCAADGSDGNEYTPNVAVPFNSGSAPLNPDHNTCSESELRSMAPATDAGTRQPRGILRARFVPEDGTVSLEYLPRLIRASGAVQRWPAKELPDLAKSLSTSFSEGDPWLIGKLQRLQARQGLKPSMALAERADHVTAEVLRKLRQTDGDDALGLYPDDGEPQVEFGVMIKSRHLRNRPLEAYETHDEPKWLIKAPLSSMGPDMTPHLNLLRAASRSVLSQFPTDPPSGSSPAQWSATLGELVSRVPSELMQRIGQDHNPLPDTGAPNEYTSEVEAGYAKLHELPEWINHRGVPTWVWSKITLHRTQVQNVSKNGIHYYDFLQAPVEVYTPVSQGRQHLNPVDISNYA